MTITDADLDTIMKTLALEISWKEQNIYFAKSHVMPRKAWDVKTCEKVIAEIARHIRNGIAMDEANEAAN